MKHLFFALLFLMCFSVVKAQDTTFYRKNIEMLLKDAQNEFVASQGALDHIDTAKQRKYYVVNVDFKCGLSAILQNLDDNSKVAIFYFDLSNNDDLLNSLPFTKVAVDIINEMNQSGKYFGKDFNNDDESSTTELKDADGNYIMELTSSSKDKYIKLMMYSKKWGKR
ncbi:MAG: hypothetical protein JSU03_06410 [Bacteroidetes bacterium]|nr:hypothetical protein [Bacteroidota bacterium]